MLRFVLRCRSESGSSHGRDNQIYALPVSSQAGTWFGVDILTIENVPSRYMTWGVGYIHYICT